MVILKVNIAILFLIIKNIKVIDDVIAIAIINKENVKSLRLKKAFVVILLADAKSNKIVKKNVIASINQYTSLYLKTFFIAIISRKTPIQNLQYISVAPHPVLCALAEKSLDLAICLY